MFLCMSSHEQIAAPTTVSGGVAGKLFRSMLSIPVGILAATSVLFWFPQVSLATEVRCDDVRQLTPNTTHGSPVDLFGSAGSLVRVYCDREEVRLEVGDGSPNIRVYQYAYERVGKKWQKITLSGTTTAHGWITGAAYRALTPVTRGYVLVYFCQERGGTWKCGCTDIECTVPKWQRQTFTRERKGSVPVTEQAKQALSGAPAPAVYRLSTNVAFTGDKVVVSGAGFATNHPGNSIVLNDKVMLRDRLADSGESLSFTVPVVEPGRYAFRVQNDGGVSQNDVLWIRDALQPVPIIDVITPAKGEQGDTYTIHGSGLQTAYNDIVTTFGVLSGQTSGDGKTMRFMYKPFSQPLHFRDQSGSLLPNLYVPIRVVVVNSGGISNEAVFHVRL